MSVISSSIGHQISQCNKITFFQEMSNIQELKAAAKRSSTLASDVCNVLGACEQRLQQLETAVLPLYGDTARLQHIHQSKGHYNHKKNVFPFVLN